MPYIPPGIDRIMEQRRRGGRRKTVFGCTHAAPPSPTSRTLNAEQAIVLRRMSSLRTMQIRVGQILRKLRATTDANANGGFTLRSFLTAMRRNVRMRLVRAEFRPRPRSDGNAFRLNLCFALDRTGRFYGCLSFDRCVLSSNPGQADLTPDGDRLWLCARVPIREPVHYFSYACKCTPYKRLDANPLLGPSPLPLPHRKAAATTAHA